MSAKPVVIIQFAASAAFSCVLLIANAVSAQTAPATPNVVAPPATISVPSTPTRMPAAQKFGAADPSLSSTVALPNTAAVLTATKDSTQALVQFSTALGGPDLEVFVAAKASTPVTASAGPTALANLDGLASAATVQLSLSPVYWSIKAPNAELMRGVCQKYLSTPSCARSALPNDSAKAEFDQAVDYGVPFFGTIAFQIGHQTFNYDAADTLAPNTAARTPIAVNASFGAFFPAFGYVGASYRHQVAYNPGASTTVCQPYSSVVGSTTCDATALGGPSRTESNQFRLEGRWFTQSFAVNPMVTYDVDQKVWGLQAPMYFITSAGASLIGGLNPGWRSDTKDLSVVFFVGAALSAAPGF